MLCEVCCKVESKYKCSKCYSGYCSVSCWKIHKSENECEAQKKVDEPPPLQKKTDTKYFTEDTINPEKLTKLGESTEIKRILKNKYLQNTLIAVENATNPENAVFEAMKDPYFVNFVDECLKIVEDLDV